MSSVSFPEEILQEVLRICLYTDKDAFCKIRSPPPKRQRCKTSTRDDFRSPSDVLQVSKQFWRIGAPILYEFLCLRQPQHLESVARVFLAVPELGKHVRCLKLESTFGVALWTIVRRAPNIKTLVLWANMEEHDPIDRKRLERSLKAMKIEELYFRHYSKYRTPTSPQAFVRGLVASCITFRWKYLHTIVLDDYDKLERGTAHAIRQAPALKVVEAASWYFGSKDINVLARSKTLEEIRIVGLWKKPPSDSQAATSLSPRAQQILRYVRHPVHDGPDGW